MVCPSEKTLEAYVQGQLVSHCRDDLEKHLEGCEQCGELVARLMSAHAEIIRKLKGLVHPSELRGLKAEPQQGPTLPPTAGQSRAETGAGGDSSLPRVFGSFSAQEKAGSGGFGTVYRGVRIGDQDGTYFAIKVLRAKDEGSKRRFLEEAKKVCGVNHPFIVKAFHQGAQDEVPYIVYEWIEGKDLRQRLTMGVDCARAARIIRQIAEALALAHSKGIVHRDVKPENIMLRDDDSPVLVDFGLGLDEDKIDGSERGCILGTPAYMSPEQWLREAHRGDGAIDVYSLGVVLYELLTGRVPFKHKDRSVLRKMVLEDKPKNPRERNNHIPPKLAEICLKAISRNSAERFIAKDFAEALRMYEAASTSMSDANSGNLPQAVFLLGRASYLLEDRAHSLWLSAEGPEDDRGLPNLALDHIGEIDFGARKLTECFSNDTKLADAALQLRRAAEAARKDFDDAWDTSEFRHLRRGLLHADYVEPDFWEENSLLDRPAWRAFHAGLISLRNLLPHPLKACLEVGYFGASVWCGGHECGLPVTQLRRRDPVPDLRHALVELRTHFPQLKECDVNLPVGCDPNERVESISKRLLDFFSRFDERPESGNQMNPPLETRKGTRDQTGREP